MLAILNARDVMDAVLRVIFVAQGILVPLVLKAMSKQQRNGKKSEIVADGNR